MSYVYIRPDNDTCWVGFYQPDGDFYIESEHDSPEAAARRVNYLNGGAPDISHVVRQTLRSTAIRQRLIP